MYFDGYWLGSRTNKTACCCPRSQSITVLLYTHSFFQNFLIHSFHLHIHKMFSISSYVKSEILDDALPWHCDVNIMWLIEPMKIRPSVKCQIAGNRWMNCWPVNRTVLQLIGILPNTNAWHLLFAALIVKHCSNGGYKSLLNLSFIPYMSRCQTSGMIVKHVLSKIVKFIILGSVLIVLRFTQWIYAYKLHFAALLIWEKGVSFCWPSFHGTSNYKVLHINEAHSHSWHSINTWELEVCTAVCNNRLKYELLPHTCLLLKKPVWWFAHKILININLFLDWRK